MTDDTPSAQSRLRTPPRERFSSETRKVALKDAFDSLPAESIQRQGHIQKALFRHGPTTTAIFVFDAGSGLREHAVEGEAIIHVLAGRITVNADGESFELGANDLLLLKPGVSHDVAAHEPTRMLLNVVLESTA